MSGNIFRIDDQNLFFSNSFLHLFPILCLLPPQIRIQVSKGRRGRGETTPNPSQAAPSIQTWTRPLAVYKRPATPGNHLIFNQLETRCLDVEREARDSAKEAPSVIAKSFVTTSKESPSPPSVVSPVVEESSVSRD